MKRMIIVFVAILSIAVSGLYAKEVLPHEKTLKKIDELFLRIKETEDRTWMMVHDERERFEIYLSQLDQFERSFSDKVFLMQQVMFWGATRTAEKKYYFWLGLICYLDVDKQTRFLGVLPFVEPTKNMILHIAKLNDSKMSLEEKFANMPAMLRDDDFIDVALVHSAVDFVTEDGRVLSYREKSLNNIEQTTELYNFQVFEDYFRKTPERSWPQYLVTFMYNSSPQEAVKTMAKVFLSGEAVAEIIQHTQDEKSKESLEYFANRSEWWAHLYAATMLQKSPSLRAPEIMEKLSQDANPLVREKLK